MQCNLENVSIQISYPKSGSPYFVQACRAWMADLSTSSEGDLKNKPKKVKHQSNYSNISKKK